MERKEAKHKRYKYRISKQVRPLSIEGEYNIELWLENTGEIKMKNPIIIDIIPSNSSITEFTSSKVVTHEIVRVFDKSELFIKMSELNSSSSILINYNLTGSSDYPKTDPIVNILDKD